MDLLDVVTLPARPFSRRCPIPEDLGPLTRVGEEVPAREVGATPEAVGDAWEAAQALYRTGLYPGMQLCIRCDGAVVLDRALGHLRGNGPDDPEDAPKVPVELDSPFCLYSASKAITAMVIHKLDEEGLLHLDDRVCEYIPEFDEGARRYITLRHVMGHRAGLPNLPKDSVDLDLLEDPDRIVRLLCDVPRQSRPGQRFAYHAVTGGFILGEVVRRATGQDIRSVLDKQVIEPLGFRFMNYGVSPDQVDLVADDALTGLPIHRLVEPLAERILGATLDRVIEMALDPRFRTGIIPAANVMASARELCAWYQCLLNEGELDGVRVYEPKTVRHAVNEHSYFEFDMTLLVPLRHGLGFMLGSQWVSPWGLATPRAFGHVGLSNIFGWADPDRRIAVALTTSGKPTASPEIARLVQLIARIGDAFPPLG